MYTSELKQYEHFTNNYSLSKDEEILLLSFKTGSQAMFVDSNKNAVKPFSTVYIFPKTRQFLVTDENAIKICQSLVVKGKLKRVNNTIYELN